MGKASNDAGCEINDKNLSWLCHIVEEWTKINIKYSEVVSGDAIYWYNERPNVGALAAAAWRSGAVAIEEYVSEKKGDGAGKDKSGRTDLYIFDSKSRNGIVIEAKVQWVYANTIEQDIIGAMGRANIDIGKTKESSDYSAGCVFYVVGRECEDNDVNFNAEIINKIRLSVHPHILAWSFPEKNCNLISKDVTGFIWPGVIMALKLKY